MIQNKCDGSSFLYKTILKTEKVDSPIWPPPGFKSSTKLSYPVFIHVSGKYPNCVKRSVEAIDFAFNKELSQEVAYVKFDIRTSHDYVFLSRISFHAFVGKISED